MHVCYAFCPLKTIFCNGFDGGLGNAQLLMYLYMYMISSTKIIFSIGLMVFGLGNENSLCMYMVLPTKEGHLL